MSDPHATATFVMACAAIIVAPGPSQALVLARTIEGGRWAGILTGIGLNVATLVHAALAGAGLSALLTTAAGAFAAVKLVGAAYLCYLGIEALRAAAPVDTAEAARAAPTGPAILARAFVTGLLNPKVAVFFLAFLPQFITPAGGPVLAQFMVLGATLAVMDVAYETALVLVAARAARTLDTPAATRWRARITGGVLVGLSARLAFATRD